MHSQNSRARSRSLSYGSSRSVRARPATAPAPTKYNDGTTMDAEEHEARRWLRIHDSDYWLQYCDFALGAFTYLENRVTNNCPAAYHYRESYQMCGRWRACSTRRTPRSTWAPTVSTRSLTSSPSPTTT